MSDERELERRLAAADAALPPPPATAPWTPATLEARARRRARRHLVGGIALLALAAPLLTAWPRPDSPSTTAGWPTAERQSLLAGLDALVNRLQLAIAADDDAAAAARARTAVRAIDLHLADARAAAALASLPFQPSEKPR